jgi:hypothetical protein
MYGSTNKSLNDYTKDELDKLDKLQQKQEIQENEILIHILKLNKQIYYENKLCQDMLQEYYKVSNIIPGIAKK